MLSEIERLRAAFTEEILKSLGGQLTIIEADLNE